MTLKYFVRREFAGVRAWALPGKDLPPAVAADFQYAFHAFGHLLEYERDYTAAEYVSAIRAQYEPSPRVDRLCAAIVAAMPANLEPNR